MTPFERQLLDAVNRTNELLETVIYALTPQKIMLGAEQAEGEPGEPMAPPAERLEQALSAAGFTPMKRPPRGDVPETPEQRQARFAARAQQVGMTEEAAATVSGRVGEQLSGLVEDETPTAPVKKAAAPKKK